MWQVIVALTMLIAVLVAPSVVVAQEEEEDQTHIVLEPVQAGEEPVLQYTHYWPGNEADFTVIEITLRVYDGHPSYFPSTVSSSEHRYCSFNPWMSVPRVLTCDFDGEIRSWEWRVGFPEPTDSILVDDCISPLLIINAGANMATCPDDTPLYTLDEGKSITVSVNPNVLSARGRYDIPIMIHLRDSRTHETVWGSRSISLTHEAFEIASVPEPGILVGEVADDREDVYAFPTITLRYDEDTDIHPHLDYEAWVNYDGQTFSLFDLDIVDNDRINEVHYVGFDEDAEHSYRDGDVWVLSGPATYTVSWPDGEQIGMSVRLVDGLPSYWIGINSIMNGGGATYTMDPWGTDPRSITFTREHYGSIKIVWGQDPLR